MHGYGLGIWWVWPVILLLGLAVVVWALIRASTAKGGRTSTERDRPREILHERFARGEITEQELRDRMRVLDEQ